MINKLVIMVDTNLHSNKFNYLLGNLSFIIVTLVRGARANQIVDSLQLCMISNA